MTSRHIEEILFSLLRITLGKEETFSEKLTVQEWKEVADFSMKQSVMGVMMPAIDKLNSQGKLPLGVFSLWMVTAEKLRKRNSRMKECAAELSETFAADGFRSCVLKGAGVAALYPEPELRQSGDVDIWVEGGIDKVLPYLRGKYKVKDVFYHHAEVRIFKDVPVEVHFTPTWLNNFRNDRRLQEWFAGQADAQFGNIDGSLGFAVPRLEFSAVLTILHLLRHLLFEGVGLRQVMDAYYVMAAMSEEEREKVWKQMEGFGLERFCSALMFVLGDVFGLEREKMLCEPDSVLGQRFLDEVMVAGNFGKYDPRNKIGSGDSLLKVAYLRLSRLTRYFVFCPSEILWAPLFKIWQFFWKKGR